VRSGGARRLGDQFQSQGRIDRGRLSGLEIREALDIVVETAADLVDGGLGGGSIQKGDSTLKGSKFVKGPDGLKRNPIMARPPAPHPNDG